MQQGSRHDTVHDYYEDLWSRKASPTTVPHIGRGATRTDVARSVLIAGDRLLDVGCWGGDGLARMEAAGRFRELYGVDLVPASVEKARSRGVRAEVVDLNLQGLPYSDGYFDAVTCLAVVPQVFDPERAVAELARVLRPEGQLVLSVSNVAFLPIRLALLRGHLPRTSPDPGWDGGQLHYFTLGATRELVAGHGLRVIGIHATGRLVSLRQLWPSLLSRDLVFDLRRSAPGT
jgi:SAM-dependent methyltransferase